MKLLTRIRFYRICSFILLALAFVSLGLAIYTHICMPDDQGNVLGLTLCAAAAVLQSWMLNDQGNILAYELTHLDDEEYYDDEEEQYDIDEEDKEEL